MRTPSYRTAAARRTALIDFGKFFLVAGIAVWLLSVGVPGLGYHWQWYRVPRFLFTIAGRRLDGRTASPGAPGDA